MTLTVHPDLTQGSDEWLEARRGIVTASVVGQLVNVGAPEAVTIPCPTCKAPAGGPCLSAARKVPTPIKTIHEARTAEAANLPPVYRPADSDTSRGLTAVLTAERITGYTDPTWVSSDMWRGIEDEPRAREAYSSRYAEAVECGLMVEDKWGFPVGYSPDGLVGDDGLIECKSRRQKTQLLTVLADTVPAENMAQLQCGLLVSGRKWIDYVSYCGGMHLYVKRVLPDPAWFKAIVAAVAQFELTSAEMVATYTQATEGLATTERADLEVVI